MLTLHDIEIARKKIKPYIQETPVVSISNGIFFKLENHQPVVNGFKIRGAANAMVSSQAKVVMTSALGTHGFAIGYLGKILGIRTICMMIQDPPKDAELKMKQLVDEVLYGTKDFASTEQLAYNYSLEHGIHFIHPYNDPEVIAGQGTIGLELLEQVPDIKTVYVPIGGGGLISGIAIAIKSIAPHIRIVGVQPERMHAMVNAVKQGQIMPVQSGSSQAEKLAVNLNPKTVTFDFVRQYVDYFITPSETEISEAMRDIYLKTKEIAEGSGAIAYAAAITDNERQDPAVCIVSGGNIALDNFKKITGITL